MLKCIFATNRLYESGEKMCCSLAHDMVLCKGLEDKTVCPFWNIDGILKKVVK